MENIYHKFYYQAILNGLTSTIFEINSTKKDPELFFKEINDLLIKIKNKKARLFFFGNGASSAFANHMALDFSKNGKILSRSISDSALMTALANDYSYEDVFLEYLKLENPTEHDLIITISSSGNSSNVVNLLNYCKLNNIKSLSLSGLKKENKSKVLSKYSIYVPMKTYGMVECIHQIFLHLILDKFMEIYEWDRKDFQNMNSQSYKL